MLDHDASATNALVCAALTEHAEWTFMVSRHAPVTSVGAARIARTRPTGARTFAVMTESASSQRMAGRIASALRTTKVCSGQEGFSNSAL